MSLVLVLLAITALIVLVVATTTSGFDEMFDIRGRGKTKPLMRRCVHCGQEFDLNQSAGWRLSGERCTCNHCYWTGQRDSDAAPGNCLKGLGSG